METTHVQRRYDLDWLRVLAFSGVFLYHCSRFFNSADWHIKNVTTSPVIDLITSIFDLWGMPLLFAVSGASIFFALRPNQAGKFIRERVARLLIPMVIGILLLAPPQVYFDRLTHGNFSGSFIEFLPHYFEPANFSWNGMHLWYLVYLFVFTLALTPLFIWLKHPSGQTALKYLGIFSSKTGSIYLWTVPIVVVTIAVDPFGMLKPSPSEAFIRLVLFPLPFIYGFLIYASQPIQQAIIRHRRVSLVISLIATITAGVVSALTSDPGWQASLTSFILIMLACSLLIWSYLLTAFGYGMRYLTSNKQYLSYANEAVLPIYIIHQPIILSIGFFVIPLQLPILVKYLMIAPLALAISLAIFEFGIRRVNLLRYAFGLKIRSIKTPASKLAPASPIK